MPLHGSAETWGRAMIHRIAGAVIGTFCIVTISFIREKRVRWELNDSKVNDNL